MLPFRIRKINFIYTKIENSNTIRPNNLLIHVRMSYLKKLATYIILMILSICLSMFESMDKLISISIDKYEISVHTSFIVCAASTILFSFGTLKAIVKFAVKFFKGNAEKDLQKSINEIIDLLFLKAANYKYSRNNMFLPLKYAILCFFKKDIPTAIADSELKKYPRLVMNFKKLTIRRYLDSGECDRALDLLEDAISSYPKYASVLMDEIIHLRLFSIRNNRIFKFDPEKYKYELPSLFINKYKSLSFLEMYRIEDKKSKRVSFLNKGFEADKTNINIIKLLVSELISQGSQDKKIVNIVKESFSLSPTRNLAYVLSDLKRNDLFEIGQEITGPINSDNIEKQWFLCILALKSDLHQKMLELFLNIIKIGEINDIMRFFISNHATISTNTECVHLIKRKVNQNEKISDTY